MCGLCVGRTDVSGGQSCTGVCLALDLAGFNFGDLMGSELHCMHAVGKSLEFFSSRIFSIQDCTREPDYYLDILPF